MSRLTRRRFLKMVIGASCLGLGGAAYGRTVEPSWIEVVPLRLRLPRLDAAFDGLRIAHISDIHMDRWMTPQRLTHVVDVINAHSPDIVALTGDFVTGNPARFVDGLESALRGLKPREASFGVLGNHDLWTGEKAVLVREALRRSGVIELPNKVNTLRRGKATLHIAGVDDPWSGHARINDVLAQLPDTGAAILLAHEPDYADEYSTLGRFDLQLSGHSHGGQIVPPFGRPIVLPPRGRKYPAGWYQVGTMQLYTTRGVGMLPPHIRFNCRPEVTLFTLQSA